MTMLNSVTPTNGVVKVSYPSYGDTKEIEVNFEELDRKEDVKVDCIHPNLYTQAIHAINGIENHKNKILRVVDRLFEIEGADIICTHLDSIYNYIDVEHGMVKTSEGCSVDNFRDVMNHVYCMKEAAKLLLELYLNKEYIKENVQQLEYAQKGVLI